MCRGVAAGVALAILAALSGCAPTERVADGPIEVGPEPLEVAFTHPAEVRGPVVDLCLEFDVPGDSRSAGMIRAILVGAAGERDTLRSAALDRRGEAIVCLLHQVDTTAAAATAYRAVLLQSERPVTLRGIRWFGGGR